MRLKYSLLFLTLSCCLLSRASEFSGATPIKSIYTLDRAELAPFGERMRDKKIIGLGEVMHGTHSAHAMRFQMIKYLIEDYGFRLIAFEAPWLAAEETNSFVSDPNSTVSLRDAFLGLSFYAWFDVSVFELLKWVKQFNLSNPNDKVSVVGIDIQGSEKDRAFLIEKAAADPRLQQFSKQISQCMTSIDSNVDESFQKRRQTCKAGLSRFLDKVSKTKKGIDRKTSLWFRLAASSLSSFQDQLHAYKVESNFSMVHNTRDPGMVYNLELMRSFYGGDTKTIFYAHNAHIEKATHELPGLYESARLAGTLLSEKYKNSYAAVGAISYITEINQELFKGWKAISPVPEGSLEFVLNSIEIETDHLLIDLKSDFLPPGQKFWIHNSGQLAEALPSQQYDFLFFSKHSPALIVPQ